jgi:isocitrate lyase
MVRAGLEAIYLSGWQVAADANTARAQMYPDQSLYPATRCRSSSSASTRAARADQIEHAEGGPARDWFAPIVADAEAGFGGPLNAFELMKGMIEAGAAGVHFEDQLASARRSAATWAARCSCRPPVHPHARRGAPRRRRLGRAHAARRPHRRRERRSSSPRHRRARPPFITGERTAEGFYRIKGNGIETAIARGLAYAPYADLVWCETSTPDLAAAKKFAEGIHAKFPGQDARVQLLALVQLEEEPRRRDHRQVPARARRDGLQVPVRHARRLPRAQLRDVRAASQYKERGMAAYSELQQAEFAAEKPTATPRPSTSARSAPATSTATCLVVQKTRRADLASRQKRARLHDPAGFDAHPSVASGILRRWRTRS